MMLVRLLWNGLRSTFSFQHNLVLSFAFVASFGWWLTPCTPRSVLPISSDCDLMQFSPDGKSLVTARHHSFNRVGPLRVWDVGQGVERFAVAHHWVEIETVLFSPDSKLLAAHEREGGLIVWDVDSGEEQTKLQAETKCRNWVNFGFTPDSKFLVFQDYSKGWPDRDFCTVWSIADRQVRGSIESYFPWLRFAAERPAFATIILGKGSTREGKVVLGRLVDGQPVVDKEFPVVADTFTFSADLGRLATAVQTPGSDGPAEVALWDTSSGTKTCSFPCDQKDWRIQQMQFVGDQILFAAGGGGKAWDISAVPRELKASAQPITISPDGNWAAVSLKNGADLYDLKNAGNIRKLLKSGDAGPSVIAIGHGSRMWPEVSFSPDSSIVVVQWLINFPQRSILADWLPQQVDFLSGQELPCPPPEYGMFRLGKSF